MLAGALLLGGSVSGAEPRNRLEEFFPPGWEAGECPASYGKDSRLCAGTDRGPYKVDHHVPTAWVRAPDGTCKEAREAVRRDVERKGFQTSSETVGRCDTSSVPCVEHVYRARSADSPRIFEYVLCPPKGLPLVVSYVVSSRVAEEFHRTARQQVRWVEGPAPAARSDPIRIGADGTAVDPVLALVRSHRPEIEHCRADALAAGRTPVGTLVVSWSIDPDGHVVSAETSIDGTRDPTLNDCVLSRIRTWQFPAPGKSAAVITVPFEFRTAR